ncbi:MAG: DUF3667 domain-containing protein [Asticcacaulis sp.]
MTKELELFSLDGLGSWFGRNTHNFVPAPGQKCLNCDTELAGRFCHQCGQDADTHHRTIGHLVFEAFEGLFHVDGRLWQTLPPLFFAPGKLARDLMEGRFARHVPPFRIFLVALLVFMFVAEHKTEQERQHPHAATAQLGGIVQMGFSDSSAAPPLPKPGDREQAQIVGLHTGDLSKVHETVTVDPKTGARTTTRTIDVMTMSEDDARYLSGLVANSQMKPRWLKDDLVKALSDKERFFTAMFTWGHRLALLLLPILGLSLAVLYGGKKYKRFYLYDHLLVAMNLLSFAFFTNALRLLLPDSLDAVWAGLLAIWTLANLFLTLRGAYGSSVFGAIVKSVILWAVSGMAFVALLVGVMFISLTIG